MVEFSVDRRGRRARPGRRPWPPSAPTSRDLPAGLSVHLTGPLPELVDQQRAGEKTANHVELVSAILILVLLAVAFRSALAPLAALAPAGLALALAGPVIAESARLGVEISSLLQLLLTALVLGAGTDYGLFLIFRYRENLRRGLAPDAAIEAAVGRVGESITFSAATVIAALLSLLLASFGLYRGVGPGLALGILVVLLIELTFFPALLSILGRSVFWPSVPEPGPWRAGRWGAVAARVSGRPVTALVDRHGGVGRPGRLPHALRAIGLRPRWVHRRFGLGGGGECTGPVLRGLGHQRHRCGGAAPHAGVGDSDPGRHAHRRAPEYRPVHLGGRGPPSRGLVPTAAAVPGAAPTRRSARRATCRS